MPGRHFPPYPLCLSHQARSPTIPIISWTSHKLSLLLPLTLLIVTSPPCTSSNSLGLSSLSLSLSIGESNGTESDEQDIRKIEGNDLSQSKATALGIEKNHWVWAAFLRKAKRIWWLTKCVWMGERREDCGDLRGEWHPTFSSGSWVIDSIYTNPKVWELELGIRVGVGFIFNSGQVNLRYL